MGPDRLLSAHSPVAVDLDGVVTLRMEEEGLGSRAPVSCYTALHSAVQRWPGNTAWVHQEKKWNYEEYFHQVTTFYTASANNLHKSRHKYVFFKWIFFYITLSLRAIKIFCQSVVSLNRILTH